MNHESPSEKEKGRVASWVASYYLLAEGNDVKTVARLRGISRQAVEKHLRVILNKRLLERIPSYPFLYQVKPHGDKPEATPPMGSATLPPSKIKIHCGKAENIGSLPHRFGVIFSIVGKQPNLNYKKSGWATYKRESHTLQVSKNSVIIWMKAFYHGTVDNILDTAFNAALDIAARHSAEIGIESLAFKRILPGAEWAFSEELSQKIAAIIGIRKGDRITFAKTELKYWDSTHKKQIELNMEKNSPIEQPTIAMRNLEQAALNWPEMQKTVSDLVKDRVNEQKTIAGLVDLGKVLTENNVVIKTELMMIQDKLKR
jgi:urease gamma subunit